MNMKNIKVDKKVWKTLKKMKLENEEKRINDVIEKLIESK